MQIHISVVSFFFFFFSHVLTHEVFSDFLFLFFIFKCPHSHIIHVQINIFLHITLLMFLKKTCPNVWFYFIFICLCVLCSCAFQRLISHLSQVNDNWMHAWNCIILRSHSVSPDCTTSLLSDLDLSCSHLSSCWSLTGKLKVELFPSFMPLSYQLYISVISSY